MLLLEQEFLHHCHLVVLPVDLLQVLLEVLQVDLSQELTVQD